MNKIFISFCFVLIFIVSSCSVKKIISKGIEGLSTIEPGINKFKNKKNNEKEVIFIGTIHLADTSFYKKIYSIVSEYQDKGFFVFYEGLIDKQNTDSLTLRKFRKTLPVKFDMYDIYNLNYKNVLNNLVSERIPGYKLPNNFVHQPSENFLIKNLDNSEKVDITFNQDIIEYEKLFGEIILNECDFKNKWSDTNCYPQPHSDRNKIVIDYRDKHLVNKILSSKQNKILILYGKAHFNGIKKNLTKNGFCEKE